MLHCFADPLAAKAAGEIKFAFFCPSTLTHGTGRERERKKGLFVAISKTTRRRDEKVIIFAHVEREPAK